MALGILLQRIALKTNYAMTKFCTKSIPGPSFVFIRHQLPLLDFFGWQRRMGRFAWALVVTILLLVPYVNSRGQGFGGQRPRQQTTTLYDTLGVSKDASQAEIKRAYRKMARVLHPDTAEVCNVCEHISPCAVHHCPVPVPQLE